MIDPLIALIANSLADKVMALIAECVKSLVEATKQYPRMQGDMEAASILTHPVVDVVAIQHKHNEVRLPCHSTGIVCGFTGSV